MPLRQPIVVVLGHVDHGKTTLLDKIRGTAVALREAGEMTQHIGASFFPMETIREICGPVMERMGAEVEIPGLLVIDTPGHSSFVNLRRRGGSVADIAILVVDVRQGFEAQTYEVMDLLKTFRTPFIVAANKIDLVPGWRPSAHSSFMEAYGLQEEEVRRGLDGCLFTIMGSFSRLGFRSERFDRVSDFTKTVAIVPVSAKTGEGIPELLAVLVGLTQQFMKRRLLTTDGPAKGTVLEVKEETGLGTTVNAIIYDGVLRHGDTIVLGGRLETIATKVRAILLPKPLDEIRDPRDRFVAAESVSAAVGVKIVASNLEEALAGAPIAAVSDESSLDETVRRISEEVEKVKISTDKVGVILKADTLGSLEAIIAELEKAQVPIRIADVGDVSRRDVVEAATVRQEAPLRGVVLDFNVRVLPDAEKEALVQKVRVFESDIIYRLVEEYLQWVKDEQEAQRIKSMDALILPGKMRVIPGYVFRRSKPAVFGVEVLAGRVKSTYPMMKADGTLVDVIAQIQDKGESIQEASAGMEVAVSMRRPIIGRHVREGEVLYVKTPESHARALRSKFESLLTADDLRVLDEITEIMRKQNPLWAY